MPRFDLNHDDDSFDDPETVDEASISYDHPSLGGVPPVSGKAIASLVFSVMFCVPMVPSLLATLFGISSLRDIRRGVRSGRGYGLAGLILGSVGVGVWLLLGAIIYLSVQVYTTETKHATDVANAFSPQPL